VFSVGCSAYQGACDWVIPCHGGWDALLFATVAAEGITELALHGLAACDGCPRHFGSACLQQSMAEYKALSCGMELRLTVEIEPLPAIADHAVQRMHDHADADGHAAASTRRTFFRQLLPTIVQGAAITAAQLGEASRSRFTSSPMSHASHATQVFLLPLRQRLFVRALDRLQPSFTPIPASSWLPLGAIQADDGCTACGDCVALCPTDALSLRKFGKNMILELQPDRCIGCQFCVEGCTVHALCALPTISLPAIAMQRLRPLVMVTAQSTE